MSTLSPSHETASGAPHPSPQQLETIACHLAQVAVDTVAEVRARFAADSHAVALTKSSATDPVTMTDQAVEKALVAALATLRPDDGVVGEEGADHGGTSGVSWIIDPIDGTVNYVYGLPLSAVSIAAAHQGRVVAGVVVNVFTGQAYRASLDGGAFTSPDGPSAPASQWQQLTCSQPADLATSLLATGFSYSAQRRARQAALLAVMLPLVRDIRRLGSAAIDLCLLAEGKMDLYYEHGLQPWDWAAGALIAAEAGAHVTTPALDSAGERGEVVWAAAPTVAVEFAGVLAEHTIDQPLPQTLP